MPALSPEVVAAIDDLELAARIVVEGLRTGGHRSPFHGYSTEFRQHRPYRAGDDLKHLDWKVYARSDRLYTRQFREATNLSVMIALDTSASMDFPATGTSKFRYAQIAAAALAYLAADQGHAVGLMTIEHDRLSYGAARAGRVHLRSLLAHLDRLVPGGRWDAPRVIERAAHLLQRRGMIIVISDFYDDDDATQRALRRVSQRGHDVAMLHVLSRDELALPAAGPVELEDAESGARRLADAAMADAYRSSVDRFLTRCRTAARAAGIDYTLMMTDVAPQLALRDFLVRRT
jgi:uncharacterized protein (DUF58 family)